LFTRILRELTPALSPNGASRIRIVAVTIGRPDCYRTGSSPEVAAAVPRGRRSYPPSSGRLILHEAWTGLILGPVVGTHGDGAAQDAFLRTAMRRRPLLRT
jgi:hypothetical protein